MPASGIVVRRRAMLSIGALAALTVCRTARAGAPSPYPGHPVTHGVPFPAGGSTDLVARLLAAEMTEQLGQQVVIENRGGAGGTIGSAAVARADPVGYTILMGTIDTHALNPSLYQ